MTAHLAIEVGPLAPASTAIKAMTTTLTNGCCRLTVERGSSSSWKNGMISSKEICCLSAIVRSPCPAVSVATRRIVQTNRSKRNTLISHVYPECALALTDYWVNDVLGQPFFAVERPIDHGLLEVLRSDVVPRLLREVPGQPTAEELEADRYRARFVMVFDREGYSPEFFKEMWQIHRIACITYHKHPKDNWPTTEFVEYETTLPSGFRASLKLAERGAWIGDKKSGLWVREIRKLTESGHQVSLISTIFGGSALDDSVRLFSRWSQENFLRYMMEHFAIDLLNEYRTEEIPETKRPVVSPKWRELDRRRRSVKSKLTRRQARFAALTLHPESDEKAQAKWAKRKAELVEAIEQFEKELSDVNDQLKKTPSHLKWDELPETERFERLAPSRKQLVDTVKMIAYRAETAMASIVRETLARADDSRSLLRDLFRSEADLLPDVEHHLLRVQVHPMSNPRSNRAIAHLLEHLNAAEFTYPGTNLQLVYSIAGEPEILNLAPDQNPADQEV